VESVEESPHPAKKAAQPKNIAETARFVSFIYTSMPKMYKKKTAKTALK
jgi:hypothetical protein